MTRTRGARLCAAAAGLVAVPLVVACGSSSAPQAAPLQAGTSTGSSPAPAGQAAPAPSGSAAGPPSRSAGAGTQAPVPVESNPAGDIPDSAAFVAYRNAAAGYRFTYPEGWARTENGTAVTMTDKLDGIAADTVGAPGAPTVEGVRAAQVPRLQQTEPAFELRSVAPVAVPAGHGVLVVYRRNSAPDPVTGRQVRDEVQSYLIAAGGRAVRLDLFGPVGADNVDAYRTISRSLALS